MNIETRIVRINKTVSVKESTMESIESVAREYDVSPHYFMSQILEWWAAGEAFNGTQRKL